MKPILVSGIQSSGRLHLGNYLGALKNFVELQNSGKYSCYFFIADLHSLTEFSGDPKEKQGQILELTADYLSVGLDPKKSLIFQQSQVSAHSELAWILNTLAPLGELERMTQFKDKSANQKENINAGLFTYPVLMAADIILYDAKYVPVGEDQLQHLELTRTLARKFNSKFGEAFIEPRQILTKTPRVMSLGNPNKKMSKSQPETCLFLDDQPDTIKAKVMRAVTDSETTIKYDPVNKKGVSNLLEIFAAVSGETINSLEKKFADKSYAELKFALADAIIKELEPIRKRKIELMKNPSKLKKLLDAGSKKANVKAQKKITEVKKKIGLI